MSYKIDLSQLDRDGEVSLTQQVVDRFAAAIESGELEPGEKLPPTRELAELVGVNHLTAARVYRRLARLELTGVDGGREAVDHLLGQRDVAIAVELGQVDLV